MSTTSEPLMEVSEISHSLQKFGWADYLVFVSMLISCSLVGVYYGYKDSQTKKKRKSRRGSAALEYLVGGRKMKIFPITVSLVARYRNIIYYKLINLHFPFVYFKSHFI